MRGKAGGPFKFKRLLLLEGLSSLSCFGVVIGSSSSLNSLRRVKWPCEPPLSEPECSLFFSLAFEISSEVGVFSSSIRIGAEISFRRGDGDLCNNCAVLAVLVVLTGGMSVTLYGEVLDTNDTLDDDVFECE